MKNFMFGLLALVATAGVARAELWSEDYPAGAARAKQEGKYILLDFTGSDWCGWCKRLKAEVFSRPSFKEYARENLVCLTIDFPRGKEQSKELQDQNNELSDKFAVAGYPTIILLDPEGAFAGQTGYMPGGPTRFVENLKAMIEQDKARKAHKVGASGS